MAQLKVTQIRSTIGNKKGARDSVRSLGLKRMHQSVVVEDNPVNRGYLKTATHLLSVETIDGSEAGAVGATSAKKD
ncbi:50S ribosomal protein L30 [Nakamurella lactea]|uniref:50S ribosomal protein L30 n=1 Tax=Nakamurella lactea TaxID=459515 RepID=UPI0004154AAD|nr:50S ribosomal protein L30 [Nakamurella lactea]